jgi:hypothetical protein
MNPLVTSSPPPHPPSGTGPGLSCAVLSGLEEVEALRADWLDLMRRSDADEAMLSPSWLLTWWRVYGAGTGRELRVGVFREGGRLVGLAPLSARRFRHRFRIPFRRLEPLGADVDEGDGVCSDYLNVIAERGAEARVARALTQGLIAGAFGGWDEFVLPAMDGGGAMPTLLVEAFTEAGLRATREETGAAPYIPLPATWDAYLKALSRKHRYSVTSSLRRFDAWAEGRAELRRAGTPAELDEGQRVLRRLHGQRWQEAGGGRGLRRAALRRLPRCRHAPAARRGGAGAGLAAGPG